MILVVASRAYLSILLSMKLLKSDLDLSVEFLFLFIAQSALSLLLLWVRVLSLSRFDLVARAFLSVLVAYRSES